MFLTHDCAGADTLSWLNDHILMRPRLAEAAQNFFATVYLFFPTAGGQARAALVR